MDGLTFLASRDSFLVWRVIFSFAHTLDVYLFRLSEFTTVLALSNRATLLLYLEKRAICVLASRGTMTFDTSFAMGRMSKQESIGEAGRADVPGIFFVTNENLNDRRASWGAEGSVRKRAWTGGGNECTIDCG
jgi:hypothetical protein